MIAISVSAILFFIVLFVASRDFSSVKSHFRGPLIVGILDSGWVAHSLCDQTPAGRKGFGPNAPLTKTLLFRYQRASLLTRTSIVKHIVRLPVAVKVFW